MKPELKKAKSRSSNSMSEVLEETNGDSKLNESSSAKSKQKKWKPLIVDLPKRERKSYRSSRSSRADIYNDENMAPAHFNKRSTRTKSLDRQQQQQQQQQGQDSTKSKEDEQRQVKNPKTKLNKSFNDAVPQRHHSSGGKQVANDSSRPLRFERATAAAKAYRNSVSSRTNGKIKRENHKDYLYGEDAIIVEEVPIIVSVAPNGVYCATVATTSSTNGTVLPLVLPPDAAPFLLPADPQSLFYNTLYPAETLKDFVRRQIEYYFSDENLEHDIFLRRKMDSQGFIALAVIASFNRVKSLSLDYDLIIDAVRQSQLLDLAEVDKDLFVRCKTNPLKWPIAPLPDNLPSQLNPNVAEFVPKFALSPKTIQSEENDNNNNNYINNNNIINNTFNNSIIENIEIIKPQVNGNFVQIKLINHFVPLAIRVKGSMR